MTAVAKLSSKFQISIPKEVREQEGWKPGQRFVFLPTSGGFVLVPVPEVDDIFGIAKGADPTNYRDREDRF